MNKNTLIFGIIGLIIIAGIAYLGFRNQPTAPVLQTTPAGGTAMTGTDTTATGDAMIGKDASAGASNVMDVNGVKTVTIDASPFKFSVSEIRVKKGDKVKIILTNSKGMHDWKIDEFNAQTKQIQAGQTDSVEFTANKAGTFEYYCSVGTHRAMGMKGNLIVE